MSSLVVTAGCHCVMSSLVVTLWCNLWISLWCRLQWSLCDVTCGYHCVISSSVVTVWCNLWISLCDVVFSGHCVMSPVDITVWCRLQWSLCDVTCVVSPVGAAPEVGDGAERGGEEQGEAAEKPPGADWVHTHVEDHTHLHPQPLQGEW